MVTDHAGHTLFPGKEWMRCVGRLAFPIYCFLLTEGFKHTRNVFKYMGRLLLFGFISEVPYDLINSGKAFDPSSQNVYFTLFLGVLMMFLIERSNDITLKALALVSVMLCAETLHVTYSFRGIYMILSFYLFKDFPLLAGLNFLAANIRLYRTKIQYYGGFALIPVFLYNGKKGPAMKYFFYLFYPLHLILIYLTKRYFS